MNFEKFPYLGLWAKPGASYVCIEPWLGIADSEDFNGDFNEKELMQSLDPKQFFNAEYHLEMY